MDKANRHVICALDTADVFEAIQIVRKLSPHVTTFKVGHALTLNYGLDVVDRLQDAGASRIFLDLKFHDIPNSVALAVAEAAKRGVWMMTLHIAGGPAMMTAAVEEAMNSAGDQRPILVGVSVLTSLDQHILTDHLGVQRTVEEHMIYLSRLAIDFELDGVVCSPFEVKAIRQAIGHRGIIVTPGIRLPNSESQDQRRVGDANTAISDGADYVVIGRPLIHSSDIVQTLSHFGLVNA